MKNGLSEGFETCAYWHIGCTSEVSQGMGEVVVDRVREVVVTVVDGLKSRDSDPVTLGLVVVFFGRC